MRNRLLILFIAATAAVAASITATSREAGGQSTGFRLIGGPFATAGGTLYWLDTSNVPQGWKALPQGSLTVPPVDVSTIAYYDGQRAITDAGEGWGKVAGVWTDLGPIPTTAVQRSSWGEVKARYR